MAWTYSGNPSTSDVDKYRFIIGDTDSANPIMQDEEIQFIVDTYKTERSILYQMFTRAATIFARDIKRSLGPQAEDPTERLKFYKEQAAIYAKESKQAGISLPTYAYPQIFRKGMHSNPPYDNEEGGDGYLA